MAGKLGIWAGRTVALAAMVALAGCGDFMPAGSTTGGVTAPPAPAIPATDPVDVRSPASLALAAYYQRLQDSQLSRGLLRVDGGGPDTPFTDTMLAQNFVAIGLFDEYTTTDGDLQARRSISTLRRWDKPIRMAVEFGATVPPDQQLEDRANVARFADRLSRITGVSIAQTAVSANFNVLILNEDDRLGIATRLRQLAPGIADSSIRFAVNLPRDQLCIVIGIFGPDGATYERAVAIIRGEHPDLLRLSCIHEELAQGLGLVNDSPRARPSIFNDDEEFAYLTTHDEYLLRILYDPRLRPGMTAAEAAPIVRRIATELLSGTSS